MKLHWRNNMADTTNPPQVEIIYESVDEVVSKSKRLNYEKIKELFTQAQEIRAELGKTQSKEAKERLNAFLEELGKLQKSASKYLNCEEVMSDVAWITQYIKAGEWDNVTRWLCNIDSSLREMWSQYIEQIIQHKQ
jgi:hypothetical protein